MQRKRISENQEFLTQEIMQYAIVVINKMGFIKNQCYAETTTRNIIVNLLSNFDYCQYKLKIKHGVIVSKDEVYSDETIELADKVLDYFANYQINSKTKFVESNKKNKEIALNMYSTRIDIATICFMYEAYCKIKKIGR